MPDYEGGRETNSPRANHKNFWVARCIRKIQRYFQKRRAEKKKENSTDRAARSTARATWAIAFLTLVTIGVGVSQYVTFDRQLNVMEADQRAWIAVPKITVEPIGKDVFRFNFVFTNVGRTAAQDLYLDAKFVPTRGWEEELRNLCKDAVKIGNRTKAEKGWSIAPGGSQFPVKTLVAQDFDSVPLADLKALTKPTIVGCASYLITTDNTIHQTGFIAPIDLGAAGPSVSYVWAFEAD